MAVFTPITDEQAAGFLELYGLGALETLTAIAEGVENTNYKVSAGGRPYVLTLFEGRVKRADLPFYLGLTEHLADRGYPAPRPLAQRDGRVLGELAGRPAAIITWLHGAWRRRPTVLEARAAGAMLAAMHQLARDFPGEVANPWGAAAWRALAAKCQAAAREPWQRAMADNLSNEAAWLDSHWPADLPHGVIHGDYFPDNVFFTGETITGVIDYYFGCVDFLVYDLAIAINAWAFDEIGAYRPDIAAALCAGYDAQRPLSSAEINALPLLCRAGAVRFTVTRLHDVLHHDANWLVTPKDPKPFFARLGYHRQVASAAAYGLAA